VFVVVLKKLYEAAFFYSWLPLIQVIEVVPHKHQHEKAIG
jgi:hypothetical protein